ncbi:hypothetical protein [Pseudomonas chlororaphis]|uniref:hypothetical protein n=1 Tax=Pseudomonas chlororaphis TaxID=587753 RepID=UPI0038576EC3
MIPDNTQHSWRDGRNLGYGRQLSYAGPPALKDLFGGGHYGTVKAHSDRRKECAANWKRKSPLFSGFFVSGGDHQFMAYISGLEWGHFK